MKTRVNLYLPHLRPVKEILPLNQFIILSVTALILMVVSIIGLTYVNSSLNANDIVIKNTLRINESVFLDKTNELVMLTSNSPLLDKIEKVKKQISEKKKIIATLEIEIEINSGFSSLFSGLADIKMHNVWLTHIATHNGQLNFGGSALNSRDIPRWVKELESSPVLNGQKFSNLAIKREDKIVYFTLHNDLDFVVGGSQ